MQDETKIARRECDTCSLCCKLVPVAEVLNKPANTWCKHAKPGHSHACTIYDKRPESCRAWNCLWLDSAETAPTLERPDRAHYVIDMAMDTISITADGGEREDLMAMQVWADPNYPKAWGRDIPLRNLMQEFGLKGVVTIVRIGNVEAYVVIAPNMTSDGNWIVHKSNLTSPIPHTVEEITAVGKQYGMDLEIVRGAENT